MIEIGVFRRAAEAFNANPQDLDARQALRKSCEDRRVLVKQKGGLIDIAQSVAVLSFTIQTGRPGLATAATPEELFAEILPEIEAAPDTGEPLLDGKTTSHPVVDWSEVPMERREIVAYGAEQGESLPSSEHIVHVLRKPAGLKVPPWSRLETELAALKAKARKTEAEEALLMRVRRRLHFQKDAQQARREPVEIADGPMGRALRKFIDRRLPTDSDLNAFCLDYFRPVYSEFSAGMERTQKVTILMTRVSEDAILAALRKL